MKPILPGIEAQLEARATQLAHAQSLATTPTPRRARGRRRLLGFGAGLAVAGAAAALVFGVTGGGKLDVISEATAAIQQEGEITHMVTEVRSGPDGSFGPTFTTEQWSATSPLRWRTRQMVDPEGGASVLLPYLAEHGGIDGVFENSYAGGVVKTWVPNRNTLDITTGQEVYEQSGPPAPHGAPELGEPLTTLRALFAEDRLRDGGTTTFEGRTVRRLSGTTPQRLADGFLLPSEPTIEYFVDPDTFTPVYISRRALSQDGTPIESQIRFLEFDRLPDSPQNARLLAVDPPASTDVFTHDP